MTQKEFWEILGKTKNWKIVFLGLYNTSIIRANDVCPVCAVANYKAKKKKYITNAEDARIYLDLNSEFTNKVARAADIRSETRTRKKLLKVCRLDSK